MPRFSMASSTVSTAPARSIRSPASGHDRGASGCCFACATRPRSRGAGEVQRRVRRAARCCSTGQRSRWQRCVSPSAACCQGSGSTGAACSGPRGRAGAARPNAASPARARPAALRRSAAPVACAFTDAAPGGSTRCSKAAARAGTVRHAAARTALPSRAGVQHAAHGARRPRCCCSPTRPCSMSASSACCRPRPVQQGLLLHRPATPDTRRARCGVPRVGRLAHPPGERRGLSRRRPSRSRPGTG